MNIFEKCIIVLDISTKVDIMYIRDIDSVLVAVQWQQQGDIKLNKNQCKTVRFFYIIELENNESHK